MQQENRCTNGPGIYSAAGRDRFLADRLALIDAITAAIMSFVDCVNRRGAGLEMAIDPYDPGTRTQPVRFRLAHSRRHEIVARLNGDMLAYNGMFLGGRPCFAGFVPRLFRRFLVMGSHARLEKLAFVAPGP